MVKKHTVDILNSFDTSQLIVRSETKIGCGILRKIRFGESKAKLFVPVRRVRVVDVSRPSTFILGSNTSLFHFVSSLEHFCVQAVEKHRFQWMDDANVSIDDAHIESIKHIHSNGKVLCLRIHTDKQEDNINVAQDTFVNCTLSVEGIYFRNNRFGLLWNVVDVQECKEDYTWRSEGAEGDEVEYSDEHEDGFIDIDVQDILDKTNVKIEDAISRLRDKKDKIQNEIDKLEALSSAVQECAIDDAMNVVHDVNEQLESIAQRIVEL